MSCNYCLTVAEIKIGFETDSELVINESFAPFLINHTHCPDTHVTIRTTTDKYVIPAEPLYSNQFFAAGKSENDCRKMYYFSNGDPHDRCTVTTIFPDKQHILIEYPEDTENIELQNCFYHLGFESILLDRNKLCLHASCIETPLGGILFSGVSGIGKSTQADLWCRYRDARYINGDRPILSKENNGWLAWGSPYAGSSKHYINDNTPVTAIMLLKQSRTCSLRRLTPAEAFRGIWAGLTVHTWDPAFVEKASALTIDLISAVPVFEFSCTPDENAVNALEQALRKELNL